MADDALWPQDAADLLWHLDPTSKGYRDYGNALRAARWLNSNIGPHDVWQFRPGAVIGGRVRLERRWCGRWEGLMHADW